MFDQKNQRVIGLDGEILHQFKKLGVCLFCNKPVMDYDDSGDWGNYHFHDFCFIQQALMPSLRAHKKESEFDVKHPVTYKDFTIDSLLAYDEFDQVPGVRLANHKIVTKFGGEWGIMKSALLLMLQDLKKDTSEVIKRLKEDLK